MFIVDNGCIVFFSFFPYVVIEKSGKTVLLFISGKLKKKGSSRDLPSFVLIFNVHNINYMNIIFGNMKKIIIHAQYL